MKAIQLVLGGAALAIILAAAHGMAADNNTVGSGHIKHVLLLSIDGMHAVDFYNCSQGIAGANGGSPYCPNMAALSRTAINYVNTESSKPSKPSYRTTLRCAKPGFKPPNSRKYYGTH